MFCRLGSLQTRRSQWHDSCTNTLVAQRPCLFLAFFRTILAPLALSTLEHRACCIARDVATESIHPRPRRATTVSHATSLHRSRAFHCLLFFRASIRFLTLGFCFRHRAGPWSKIGQKLKKNIKTCLKNVGRPRFSRIQLIISRDSSAKFVGNRQGAVTAQPALIWPRLLGPLKTWRKSSNWCLSSMQQFSLQNARLAAVQGHSRNEHACVLAAARMHHLARELHNLATIVHQQLLNKGFVELACVCL